ncbi:hypothetical protein RADP37_05508 (plasmid) [Roseomonas mucosa]|uniref:DUF4868 domain-containing protein n=1 Tax=Roseomonas mucosa TaxID=207340 RepID=A0A4Y1MQR2_9PROT|nr:hypothetical protein RADP37_05508 [Roseomonas mucosa]
MAQLYAACRQNGTLVVQHVQLTSALQNQLDGIFQAQDASFMQGISNEIDFDGDWKPDSDELLVARNLAEAQVLLSAANQNAVSLPPLDISNFQNQGVKALFTSVGNGTSQRLLVQTFDQQQVLSGRIAFLFDGNVFRRLVEPTFSLGTQLVATIDSTGAVRFKSFTMLRRIFDLASYYQQATDAELQTFCTHASLSIPDPVAFVAGADEGIRKAVLAISRTGVLSTYPVSNIETQAAAIGFPLTLNGGQIEVPQDRKGAKALFSFLLNKVYLGPINQRLHITNSSRPLI